MKVKVGLLVLLVVFAFAATSFVFGVSTGRVVEGNVGFAESYDIVQMGGEGDVGPNGIPIDTPGGPT